MLLIALSVLFLFSGITPPSTAERVVESVLVGTALVLALYAANMPPHRLRICLALIVIPIAGIVIASVTGRGDTVDGISAALNGALIALAPPAVVIGVLRNFRATGAVTLTVVAGVLCLYLLLGLFFAYLFIAVNDLGGAPFFANGAAASDPHAVYFSFITITTVGYGDYTARSNLGHTLSATEALIGQIYLVTVVAAIVGRVAPRRARAS